MTAIYQHYAAGMALASFLYAYDSDGRITGVTEGGSLVASYSYDASSELTSDGTVTYSYDGNGNRQNAGTVTYGAEAAGNELTNDGTWTYTYDAVGNVTEKYNGTETWQYTYDNANHMLTAKETNGATTLVQATYTYDVFGNLIKEVYNNGSGATTVEHAYDMWNPANSLPTVWADQNGSNAITTQYLWGNRAGSAICQYLQRRDAFVDFDRSAGFDAVCDERRRHDVSTTRFRMTPGAILRAARRPRRPGCTCGRV